MTEGIVNNYTKEEKVKLLEFRNLVSDILITEEHKEDSYLIRWLRARNLDLKQSEDMFRKHLEWRKVHNVDGILEREDTPEDFKFDTPIAYCGESQQGYPVLICPMGKHDSWKVVEKYGKEAAFRFHLINLEKIFKHLKQESEKKGKRFTQFVEIIDFQGYSYRQFSSKLCRDLMVEMQTTFDSQYPELLKCAIIVNAPKIFSLLFHLLKPFIPKRTLEKVDIYGPDEEKWRKVIAEKFPIDKIPKYWGGTLQGKDEFCSGSEIWLQGPADMQSYMNGEEKRDAEYSVITVNARDKMVKTFHISTSSSVLEWKFKTESNDIGFQIGYCNFENSKVTKVILPYSRVDAHNSIQEGSYICESFGKYMFTFDNSFSFVKSKTVLYKISVTDPQLSDLVL